MALHYYSSKKVALDEIRRCINFEEPDVVEVKYCSVNDGRVEHISSESFSNQKDAVNYALTLMGNLAANKFYGRNTGAYSVKSKNSNVAITLYENFYDHKNCSPQNWMLFLQKGEFHPNPIFDGDGPRYFGCELEVEFPNETNIGDAIHNIPNNVYLKEDGSLEEYSVEIVTHPISDVNRLESMFGEICDACASNSGDTNNRCGFHVHVSKAAFTETFAVANLIVVVDTLWTQLVKLSRRKDHELNRYARNSLNNRSFIGYTPLQKIRVANEMVAKTADVNRYRAVNVQNENTVEIRIWKASLDEKIISAYIEATDVLVDLANNVDGTNVSWKDFVEVATSKNYDNLISVCKELGIE